MPVNSNLALRRSASLGIVLNGTAMALTLAGGTLSIIGNFDTSVGQATILVRHDQLYLPHYAARFGALSYFIFAYALWRLTAFLRLSRAGCVFSAEATMHLRAFGRWLLIAAIAAAVLPLFGFAIHQLAFNEPGTWQFPPIRVPLFTGVFIIAVAALVRTICRVVDEGRRLRDELDEIV